LPCETAQLKWKNASKRADVEFLMRFDLPLNGSLFENRNKTNNGNEDRFVCGILLHISMRILVWFYSRNFKACESFFLPYKLINY